jgi:hypothetical protein
MRPLIDCAAAGEFDAVVVRTDYSDDAAWRVVADRLAEPWGEDDDDFESSNHFIDDPAYAGATADEVLAAVAGGEAPSAIFLADAETMRAPHPLLAVWTLTPADFPEEKHYAYEVSFGRDFRLVPAAVSEMHTNLALANMDFSDFSAAADVDPERIHRGFLAAG